MKKTYLIILIIAVVIIGGGVFLATRPKKLNLEIITVKKQNLLQEVSVTGKVKPAQALDLAFEKGGKVSKVLAEVGSAVKEGALLIELDNTELKAQVLEAQAGLEVQDVKLKELLRGTRIEEIQISEAKAVNAEKTLVDAQTNLTNVENKAQTDLNNLYDDVKDIISDAFTKADDAVSKQTNELFFNPLSDTPRLTFSLSDNQIKNDVEWQRVLSRNSLLSIKTEIINISTDYTKIDTTLNNVEQNLTIIKNFLNRLIDALNSASSLTQSAVNTYQGYVNIGRTNVNTAISNVNSQRRLIAAQKDTNQQSITTAQNAVNTAKNNLDLAEKELTLKKAGATKEQIQAQEAQVKQVRANLQNLNSQLQKTMLFAPISGIITKQEAKKGEIITANTIVISLISEADFEIEANIPEADIAKVKIGNPAKITLDAYGDDVVFTARVVSIDPSETLIEGVSTYKTKLQFLQKDEKVKPGMTANIDITTDLRENVFAVPFRAIVQKNGDKFLRIIKNVKEQTIEERKVETGIRASDGSIEITQGLTEGEQVVVFMQDK